MKRLPAVTREQAIAIAKDAIARDDQHPESQWVVVLDDEVGELWWAWIVWVQSREYASTRNPVHTLLGLGPYLVDKFTGEAIPTGTGTRLHTLERARGYRSWWDFRGPNSIMKL